MMNPLLRGLLPVLFAAVFLHGCASQPAAEHSDSAPAQERFTDETVTLPMLAYLRRLQGMSPRELTRERNVLTLIEQTPETQVRLAMLLGLSRSVADVARAQSLLDGVVKSEAPDATVLRLLARTLSYQYQERLRLEQMNERTVQQLKESQRRVDELQEKLNAMADIEHSIPVRPKPVKSLQGAVPGAAK